ncbi:hypothetical protein ABAZ39_13035 [Azospirillum argentinense]|uniref:DUF3987 domain-containing protein n=1 Tax=Azospirillum argentinense TaxID=2970906 RepID=A0A060DFE4_9PROT|nr:hypothetical protein ABAZ39_13035 [Azospirillum argentinense]EZQ09894.1 hypothetical protein ABAZ39_14440 [Azospirillum argentinense]
MPLAQLPPTMRDLVEATATALGVGAELVLPCVLAGALIASRGNFKVKVSDGYFEALTEYFLVIAASGERKSAVVGLFRHVFEQEEALRIKHSAERQGVAREVLRKATAKKKHELAKKFGRLYDECRDVDAVKNLLWDEIAAVERLDMAVCGDAVPRRILIDATTPQALAAELARHGEVLAIFEAEGRTLKQFSPAMDDIFLKGFTGEPYTSDTKTAGTVRLRTPMLSICVCAQPNIADQFYGNKDLVGHGLTARFLPLFVPTSSAMSGGGLADFPPGLVAPYEAHMRALLQIPAPAGTEGERAFHVLDLSYGAYKELDRYTREIDAQLRAGLCERYAAFARKLHGHAARLAANVHLFVHPDPQNHPIAPATMVCGIALAEYFRKHAAVAFVAEARDGVTYAPKILQWMERQRLAHFTEREAHRGIGSSRHTVAQIRAGIDELERHNFLRRYVSLSRSSICVVHPDAYRV